jgi:hypothetical protein
MSSIETYGVRGIEELAPTKVYDLFWQFAAERQNIYFKRLRGECPPWTKDPILQAHRFTNAYRASDKVSQYLIKKVIYSGTQNSEEVFFRIILFKIFNRISTWQYLEKALGEVPNWKNFDFETYEQHLSKAMDDGKKIFSAAYIMPSGQSTFGYKRKHANYLKLIEMMMKGGVVNKLMECRSMERGFELLKSYPMMGNFLAYQFIIDINYSTIINFPESDFVVAGPGAQDGIRKCFDSLDHVSCEDVIKFVQKNQVKEMLKYGVKFPFLGERLLQLIDIQNLFCEISKYSRVALPAYNKVGGRTRIKQQYKLVSSTTIDAWFPPKWKIVTETDIL